MRIVGRPPTSRVKERKRVNFYITEEVERAIEQVGIGFMFAPNFHPAMKHAIGPRREVGIRTVFNLLGPLTNPANADAQLIGVYDHSMTEPIAHVLRNLGSREAMVVHGLDGLDEISTIGKTRITWLKDGDISSKELNPEDLGLRRGAPELLEGSDPHESAKITFNILCGSGGDSSKRDMVLANSAAAIIIGGKAEDFTEAVSLAESSIDTGSAYEKLRSLIRLCGDISKLEEFESHG